VLEDSQCLLNLDLKSDSSYHVTWRVLRHQQRPDEEGESTVTHPLPGARYLVTASSRRSHFAALLTTTATLS